MFVFTDEHRNGIKVGFYVELVYHEPASFDFMTCSKQQNEAVLEQFSISRETYAEMRRNFAN
jgi:hypothetical protein